jgi:hypothetical protein
MHPTPLPSGPPAAAFPASIQSGVHRQAVIVCNVPDDGSEILACLRQSVVAARLAIAEEAEPCARGPRQRQGGGTLGPGREGRFYNGSAAKGEVVDLDEEDKLPETYLEAKRQDKPRIDAAINEARQAQMDARRASGEAFVAKLTRPFTMLSSHFMALSPRIRLLLIIVVAIIVGYIFLMPRPNHNLACDRLPTSIGVLFCHYCF